MEEGVAAAAIAAIRFVGEVAVQGQSHIRIGRIRAIFGDEDHVLGALEHGEVGATRLALQHPVILILGLTVVHDLTGVVGRCLNCPKTVDAVACRVDHPDEDVVLAAIFAGGQTPHFDEAVLD